MRAASTQQQYCPEMQVWLTLERTGVPERDPEDRPPGEKQSRSPETELQVYTRKATFKYGIGRKGQPLGTTEPLSCGRVAHVQGYPMYQSDSYFVSGTLERPGGGWERCSL